MSRAKETILTPLRPQGDKHEEYIIEYIIEYEDIMINEKESKEDKLQQVVSDQILLI